MAKIKNYKVDNEDVGVVLSTVLSSLASIERMNRDRRKDEFDLRSRYLLQGQRLKFSADEAEKDRTFKKSEREIDREFDLGYKQWEYLTNKKAGLTDELSQLSEEINATGITEDRWQNFDYFEKTDGMASLLGATKDSQNADLDDKFFDYDNFDKQLVSLTKDVDEARSNIKTLKRLKSRITEFQHELDTSLPGFYDEHRDVTPADTSKDKFEQLVDSFEVDENEMLGIYRDLAKQRPDMFGDIETNKDMQNLVRRNVLPLYDVNIQKAQTVMEMQNQIEQKGIIEQTKRTQNIQGELEARKSYALSLTTTMANALSIRSFAAGKEGNKQVKSAIQDLQDSLLKVEGIDPYYANALSELLVKPVGEQVYGFGRVINDMMKHHLGGNEKEKMIAKQLIDALKEGGVLSSTLMTEEDLKIFSDNYEEWKKNEEGIVSVNERLIQNYQAQGVDINTNKALDTIFGTGSGEDEGGDEGGDEIGYVNIQEGFGTKDPFSGFRFDAPSLSSSLIGVQNQNLFDIVTSDSSAVLDASTVTDSTEGPVLNPLFSDTSMPDWMSNYEFVGYSEPTLGFGGGVPEWIDKETGRRTQNPHMDANIELFGDDWNSYMKYRDALQMGYADVEEKLDLQEDIDELKDKISSVKSNYGEDSGYAKQRIPVLQKEMNALLTQLENLNK